MIKAIIGIMWLSIAAWNVPEGDVFGFWHVMCALHMAIGSTLAICGIWTMGRN